MTAAPEGWVMVPREPTKKMLAYGEGYADFILPAGFDNTQEGRRREMAMAYHQMLAAAPQPPPLDDEAVERAARAHCFAEPCYECAKEGKCRGPINMLSMRAALATLQPTKGAGS